MNGGEREGVEEVEEEEEEEEGLLDMELCGCF